MNAVEVDGLTFSYVNGPRVLEDICFELPAGEILVIAGLSGCGKTTLCHIISGIIPNAIKGDVIGSIKVMDIDPREAGLPQSALRAGYVFQDADSQIICSTVEDELAFGLENLGYPPGKIRFRVNELSSEFGFDDLLLTNPALLSGGQKKLLTIAAVLATAPPVLVLDEPLSSLDAEGRGLVRTALERQRDQGRAVIIVEHDLNLVTFADNWLLLTDGAVAAHGTPEEFLPEFEDVLRELGVWE